jgi:hypothetical protein
MCAYPPMARAPSRYSCGHVRPPRSATHPRRQRVLPGLLLATAVTDASEIVRTCEGCQFYARRTNLPAHTLQTIPVTWPFAVWGLNIVGPLRKAPGGYTHLLVAIDKFSKWIEVRPITNLRAEQAVTFFTDIIYRFGVPNSIISTTGPNSPAGSSWSLRQVPHPRQLGGRGASTDQRSSGARQRHDPTRSQAQDFRQTEQVWSQMAPRATSGRVEPQNHPEQRHGIHPVFPCLWCGGRSPHGLGIWVA